MNKRGWIKIIEAFLAVLLIVAALLVTIDQFYIKADLSDEVYDLEVAVLREIALNNTYRAEIFSVPDASLDVKSTGILADLIDRRAFVYLSCEGYICGAESSCISDSNVLESVYVKSSLFAEGDKIRQFKIYCWRK